MEKNIVVLDESGRMTGTTYPKRARGLVRNGRAEYINDCTIRILHTLVPAVRNEDDSVTEDIYMSKVIDFNARDFRFDKTNADGNVGSRSFITDLLGRNVESYKIGAEDSKCTRITAVKTVEPESDCIFRFAIAGGFRADKEETVSLRMIPFAGEEPTEEELEDEYVFDLTRNRLVPAESVKWNGDILRCYEIPFGTGSAGKVKLIFNVQRTEVILLPGADASCFESLEKYTYEEWLKDRSAAGRRIFGDSFGSKFAEGIENFDGHQFFQQFGQKMNSFAGTQFVNEGVQLAQELGGKMSEAVKSTMETISKTVFTGGDSEESEEKTDDQETADEGSDESSDKVTCGILTYTDSRLDGEAFAEIAAGLTDGCIVNFDGSVIGSFWGDTSPKDEEAVDGLIISMEKVTIASSAFDALMERIGDGCKLDFRNAVIIEDSVRTGYAKKSDGLFLDLGGATIPNSVLIRVRDKFEDGCIINTCNAVIS